MFWEGCRFEEGLNKTCEGGDREKNELLRRPREKTETGAQLAVCRRKLTLQPDPSPVPHRRSHSTRQQKLSSTSLASLVVLRGWLTEEGEGGRERPY
jgi:hypothetical protein